MRLNSSALAVNREVAVDSANRPDIVLAVDGIRVAVIEVKVSDVGNDNRLCATALLNFRALPRRESV